MLEPPVRVVPEVVTVPATALDPLVGAAVVRLRPELGTPELEKKFLAMMKEKFSAKTYNELMKAREEALDESKVAGELKKKDEEALDALRPKEKKED